MTSSLSSFADCTARYQSKSTHIFVLKETKTGSYEAEITYTDEEKKKLMLLLMELIKVK